MAFMIISRDTCCPLYSQCRWHRACARYCRARSKIHTKNLQSTRQQSQPPNNFSISTSKRTDSPSAPLFYPRSLLHEPLFGVLRDARKRDSAAQTPRQVQGCCTHASKGWHSFIRPCSVPFGICVLQQPCLMRINLAYHSLSTSVSIQ